MTIARRPSIPGAIAALSLPALAQDGAFPSRPIRRIATFPPGGRTGILPQRSGQPVQVANRGSATGTTLPAACVAFIGDEITKSAQLVRASGAIID